jgi:hypothetical protein
MKVEDRLTARIADANPIPRTIPPDSQGHEEARRVMQHVLSAGDQQCSPRRLHPSFGGIAALLASTLVVVAVVAVLILEPGRRTTSSRSAGTGSGSFLLSPPHHDHGLSAPAINVPPGVLVLASLGVHDGARFFIYGQRIRFEGRLYFCYSVGNQTGASQICPPWPLTHEPTSLITGGFSPTLELAAAVAPRNETCTIVDLPGGPYQSSEAQIPASLKVDGKIVYAFVKFPGHPREHRSGKSGGRSEYLSFGGRASCHR